MVVEVREGSYRPDYPPSDTSYLRLVEILPAAGTFLVLLCHLSRSSLRLDTSLGHRTSFPWVWNKILCLHRLPGIDLDLGYCRLCTS